MLQRIQSIYLFLSVVLITVSAFVGDVFVIVSKKSSVAYSYHSVIEKTLDGKFVMNEQQLLMWIFPLVIAAFGMYVIFKYKRIAKQIKLARYFWGLTLGLLIIQLALKYYFEYQLDKKDILQSGMGAAFYIDVIAMPLAHLGFMSILRDKRKIDSVDRIR